MRLPLSMNGLHLHLVLLGAFEHAGRGRERRLGRLEDGILTGAVLRQEGLAEMAVVGVLT